MWVVEQPEAIEEFLSDVEGKELVEVVSEKGIDGAKSAVYDYFIGFPAASIEKLANQLSTDDFFQGVYYYIRERESGKAPEAIRKDQPEEMEFGVSLVTVHQFGQEMYFKKLEEVYQRYIVWQMLNKK